MGLRAGERGCAERYEYEYRPLQAPSWRTQVPMRARGKRHEHMHGAARAPAPSGNDGDTTRNLYMTNIFF
jgi:hypothetical protein